MFVPLMPDHLTVSQSAWTILDMLQQQLGLMLEVLDLSLRPLTSPSGAAAAVSVADDPGVAVEARRALRSGEARVDTSRGAPVGIFPLRAAREVVGCLLVSEPVGGPARDEPVTARAIENAGHLARTALESDLALNAQLADAKYRTRRLHGILRFLGQFGTPDGEQDVMNAVVQGATVWFDLDCRIYQRQPDGDFQLAASLPGAEQRPAGMRLDAARIDKLVASRRIVSGVDVEDLGFAGRREDVLVLPIGGHQPEWVMLLAGNVDSEVELTFSAIARILAGELQARSARRALAGAAPKTEPGEASFEGRIQEEVERAKRFNLGLGLVVIAPENGPGAEAGLDTLLASIKTELRASDLLGRMRGGLVGLVLVHSGREGADSVLQRLERRLPAAAKDVALSSVQLGKAVFSADCATAEELIALAMRHARSFQLRN